MPRLHNAPLDSEECAADSVKFPSEANSLKIDLNFARNENVRDRGERERERLSFRKEIFEEILDVFSA